MSKRLVWNFEIETLATENFCTLPCYEKEALRWEMRYFWPENALITLYGLNEDWRDLSLCTVKQRQDTYYLLTQENYNIKKRRDEFLYKPLIERINGCNGFGKKINLLTEKPLPGTNKSAKNLLALVTTEGIALPIIKTVLIYKFPTSPVIKLELSLLKIDTQPYFSACIEGRSYALVTEISKHLLKDQVSCDYIDFLKQERHYE